MNERDALGRILDAGLESVRVLGLEIAALRAENEKLREAAHHLRGCRECGEMDVYDCFEGKRLWEAANLEEPALSGGDRGD